MLNQIKKISNIILVLAVVLPGLFFPSMEVEAIENKPKTLREAKEQLEQFIKEQKENNEQQQLTEAQIKSVKNRIVEISREIESISNELVTLQEEIVEAEEEIKNKDKEIKEILNFLQVASGESAYLEYAFGAKDFTDFIYRMAISEQLSSYNEELVNKQNELIENNNKRKEEITKKREDLKNKQTELAKEEVKLGQELENQKSFALKVEDQIKEQQGMLEHYEVELKCGLDEDIDECESRNRTLPYGTKFYRPIVSGSVTSEYSHRCYELNGETVCDNHKAIDVSERGSAVPVYASAPGVVAYVQYHTDCGGNRVYINHVINGQNYTTFYAHLRTILVKQDDIVTVDTQIATMGGNPAIEWWDRCSTGQHLHFSMANGHFGAFKDFDYIRWPKFEANMFNPRELVNFPARGVRFENRNRKY